MSTHNEASNNKVTFNGNLTASGGGFNNGFIQAGTFNRSLTGRGFHNGFIQAGNISRSSVNTESPRGEEEKKSHSSANTQNHHEASNNTVIFNGNLTASGGGLYNGFIQAGTFNGNLTGGGGFHNGIIQARNISRSSVNTESPQGEEEKKSHSVTTRQTITKPITPQSTT